MKPWPRDPRYGLTESGDIIGAKGGVIVGWLMPKGYRRIRMGGKKYLYHRVVMECVLGRELTPSEEVDHINHDRDDNRPDNLRIVSSSMNKFNRRRAIKGWYKARSGARPYRAQLNTGSGHLHLGSFATAELAREAYLTARREQYPWADEMDPGTEGQQQ